MNQLADFALSFGDVVYIKTEFEFVLTVMVSIIRFVKCLVFVDQVFLYVFNEMKSLYTVK